MASLQHSARIPVRAFGEREAPIRDAAALLANLRHLAEPDIIGHETPSTDALPSLTLDAAYQYCVEVTRVNSRSFHLSSQLLPREKRLAVRALYAFCRASDDTVDRATGDPARTLANWVARVHAPHPPADHPVLLAWDDTVRRYALPRALVDELLAGIAMDLTIHRYETFDDLWLYCYRVASVVGLLSMHIIGHRDGAAPYAVKLGVALQLTNILRDVGEDARRGRIYLPQEDLRRFGLTDDDILHGRRDDRFRALMRFEMERAHALYDESWPGIALLDPDGRMAIAAAAEIYRGILPRIVANDYDVFQKRAYVPFTGKIAILWRAYRKLNRLIREHR
ncbi:MULTISPECIES: squalene/phytoene synthase family protein [Roseiflexus]|jgi:phytoene synthase|uniref:Squalene/phytoene synthase n=1 Tax=Roseiflexus castenholzii (strain DSM 13941 / HLO8) TaxID=383372 RepID=A7NK24_ROSCS|nr:MULTISPECIES: squalene/phytoene synthase family protein [Roseiflexus]ABU57844.1 Squalene/phytoene synthase [Roseiflexus castenholzii DSM 13941]GIW00738.1 MAG: squalene synthase [Roseiflexus sp.]